MKRVHHEITARFCQALASPVRLHMLNLVSQGPWTVGRLAAELGESVASTSAHLKVLRAAHLVAVEKSGREVWCRLSDPEVIRLMARVNEAAQLVVPEFREAVRKAGADPAVAGEMDFGALRAETESGRLALVDLRPESEYEQGHLPGAISLPYDSVGRADLEHLRQADRVIGYCRGPWCRRAKLGVQRLNERGIPAKRLFGGIIEWLDAGLALER